MAEPKPSTGPTAAPGTGTGTGPAAAAATATTTPPPVYKTTPNPVWRMMGFPSLPQKLPSRNWLIFITLSTAFASGVIYDRREKRRATRRWARAVSHLATEPTSSCRDIPRKLTVVLASPPGDGFRAAREHFNEYVRPVLAASGLDWDFVQGRRQGDVRGAVAERIRRQRRADGSEDGEASDDLTSDEVVAHMRDQNKIPTWEGVKGDLVIGRHAWKEYVRGVHEGWLGPLASPTPEEPRPPPKEGETPPPPLAPVPYNSQADYADAALPPSIPSELSPSMPIPIPHVLGMSATFIRLRRFFTRRHLADEVGRDVAAVCLAAYRPWEEDTSTNENLEHVDNEIQAALNQEEPDWPKFVWETPKDDDDAKAEGEESKPTRPRETVWRETLATDPRITSRMRRFEISPEDEARARALVITEEEIEGWVKGSFRSAWRWGVRKWNGEGGWKAPALGDVNSGE